MDAVAGKLDLEVDEEEFASRVPDIGPGETNSTGLGRELFSLFRQNALSAEEGGSPIQLQL